MSKASKAKAIAELLERAADVVQERGWTQGQLEDERGRVCARQALGIAAGRKPLQDAWLFAVDQSGSLTLARWNDSVCRSKRQCVAALRRWARAARAEA